MRIVGIERTFSLERHGQDEYDFITTFPIALARDTFAVLPIQIVTVRR